VSLGTPVEYYSTNPFRQVPDGYYTNGTHQIVPQSGNVDPLQGSIGFGTSLDIMAMSHWGGGQN